MTAPDISRRALITGAAGALLGGVQARAGLEIEAFIDEVRRARMETDGQAAVEDVLGRTVSSPDTVLQALGEPTTAGIHTLYRGRDVTILNVIWAPLMVLLPHNHNMWASIGIYTGREDNIIWQRSGGTIEASSAASLSRRDVLGLPADAIHSVINPIGRLTGAIHVYGGDFFAPGRSEWDAERLRERAWDLAGAQDEFRRAAARFAAVP